MRSRYAAFFCIVLAAACGRQATSPSATVTPQVDAVEATGPTPRAVYKTAYERARRDITVDNAQKKLNTLDAQITE